MIKLFLLKHKLNKIQLINMKKLSKTSKIIKSILILLAFLLILPSCSNAYTAYTWNASVIGPYSLGLDAEQDGPVYGDLEGLLRVKKLEEQLHNMHVREDHPRILINKEIVQEIRKRYQTHPSWPKVKQAADNGDMTAAAFAYQLTQDPKYAQIAINALMES
ncbi:MAG: hypothetical protein DRP03_03705, partial [Candidatus Aenigmatarchaeota archaeon]